MVSLHHRRIMNVNKRLRGVDRRIAKIDRRTGFLSGRVYFRPFGTDPETGQAYTTQEVEVTDFVDLGITPKNMRTGHEVEGHRFTVRVGRDWIDQFTDRPGKFLVQVSEGGAMLDCESENLAVADGSTTGVLSLRVNQEVTYV